MAITVPRTEPDTLDRVPAARGAALAAAMAAPPRTTPIPVDLALGLDVARAAKAAGLTAPAFVEAAIRVALHLGPDEFLRAHEAAKGTAAKGTKSP